MKNLWIKKSVVRKFDRLKRIIEGRWIGLTTMTRFRKSVFRDSFIVCVKGGGSDNDILVFIYFNRIDVWHIQYRSDQVLSGTKYQQLWRTDPLPGYEDPAFLLQIEAIINKAVDEWKVAIEKEKQEEEKCETSSSS